MERMRPGLLPRALGWLSLGLGVTSLAAPRTVSRICGVERSLLAPVAVRAVGAREILHAAGLLASRRPAAWVWSRVAGDAMDLVLLGRAMAHRRAMPSLVPGTRGRDRRRRRTMVATAAVAGMTAIDLAAAIQSTRAMKAHRRAMSLRASITVNRPSDEVYRFWRDFGNLPRFMHHLESVRGDGNGRTHWTARGPAGRPVEWDAEITEERPNRMLAWRSVGGSRVPNSGRVHFMPTAGGRATEVRVEIGYRPPAGRLGRRVAMLFGEEPRQQVKDDLRRFKQVIETGEVVRSDGSPEGVHVRQQLMQRPARPMAR